MHSQDGIYAVLAVVPTVTASRSSSGNTQYDTTQGQWQAWFLNYNVALSTSYSVNSANSVNFNYNINGQNEPALGNNGAWPTIGKDNALNVYPTMNIAIKD
jgi:hypothetical protein